MLQIVKQRVLCQSHTCRTSFAVQPIIFMYVVTGYPRCFAGSISKAQLLQETHERRSCRYVYAALDVISIIHKQCRYLMMNVKDYVDKRNNLVRREYDACAFVM